MSQFVGNGGGIIHEGSFKIKIDPMTSKLTFGKENDSVATKYRKSFDEMLEWIDTMYKEMNSYLSAQT
jgi:hypothetical protein